MWQASRTASAITADPMRTMCLLEGTIPMRFGLRRPSFKKRFAARVSWKRYVRHSLGFTVPRGMGWLTNPKKAAYNRVYNRTTFDLFKVRRKRRSSNAGSAGPAAVIVGIGLFWLLSKLF